MATDDDQPYRFPLRMEPGFGRRFSREQTVGSPIRYKFGDSDEDVVVEGIVIDWTEDPDGSVTLTIEAEP